MTARSTKPQRLLNVHAFLPVSHANGPGARAVVWVQGCRLRCPGCCNLQTHSHRRRHLIDPRELAMAILAIPGIEGLTISGGEPFEQPKAVEGLCRKVRKDGLSVMLFTGWTYERIRASRDREVSQLLSQLDILVDGPFLRGQAAPGLVWRGSRNQRILFLTNRYGPEALCRTSAPVVDARLTNGSPLTITGFPERVDLRRLARHLRRKAGVILTPTSIGVSGEEAGDM
jgi:anaerobic ribonucleoside-triphosphate reductase activating protein